MTKTNLKDPSLEQTVNASIKVIDEHAAKDQENMLGHLHNVLKAIKEVFDSGSNYRIALNALYEQDPYMAEAQVKDALANIALIISGQSPDIERSFETRNDQGQDFTDYILNIQNELASKLANHYSNLVTCNEAFELLLIGENE